LRRWRERHERHAPRFHFRARIYQRYRQQRHEVAWLAAELPNGIHGRVFGSIVFFCESTCIRKGQPSYARMCATTWTSVWVIIRKHGFERGGSHLTLHARLVSVLFLHMKNFSL
jgi:hypothetical protein